ncbi:MAG: patatin-like phospholipase family protein, partial [Christensenellaceae bacterium]|nr:patatin-like phospholipase family protein [Christensenellaceae bacterium]
MGKKAVVLSGGGARGAYQAGAWKALRELDYQFDIVTGTSVGALNAAMMASG